MTHGYRIPPVRSHVHEHRLDALTAREHRVLHATSVLGIFVNKVGTGLVAAPALYEPAGEGRVAGTPGQAFAGETPYRPRRNAPSTISRTPGG